MDINISEFFRADVNPMDYSASRMELGDNSGPITWSNALHSGFDFLDTEEKRQAFREHVAGFGAWDEEEINAWDNTELNALLVQLIAGDIRDAGLDIDDPDWEAYEQGVEDGQYSSRLFGGHLSVDGEIYYYIGS